MSEATTQETAVAEQRPEPWPDRLHVNEDQFRAFGTGLGYTVNAHVEQSGRQCSGVAYIRATPEREAAPDLLAALRELLDISKTDAWNGSMRLDDALEDARAATAKAKAAPSI